MGATFSRVKTWTTETVTNTDLNAEFDNILNNLGPAGIDDYSSNAATMRLDTSPGTEGAESLATSLAGELERIRFVLRQIKGTDATYWYSTVNTSLSDLVAVVGGGLASNRISSGKALSTSSQLAALDPSTTTTSITLLGASTNFVYYVDGDQYSVTADVTVTGLSAAPSSNATASAAAPADDNQYTEFFGEYGTIINMTAAGSEFGTRVGTFQGFSINNGSATEYFVGYLNSTTQITRAWRGCFFDGSQAAIPKVRYTAGDNITLQRLGWIFATTSSSMAVTYSTPVYSHTEPSAPSTGDYWFDIPNDTWKTYNSTSWVAANATLIGMSIQSSAACVATRTFDKFTAVDDFNTVQLEWVSNTQIQTKEGFNGINVFGTNISLGMRPLVWDITANLDSGLSESASTFYYFYVKESGAPLISDKSPVDMRGSRRGLYHPSNTWRCVGVAKNDGSSNLDANTLYSFSPKVNESSEPVYGGNYKVEYATAASAISFKLLDRIGNYPSDLIPTHLPFHNTASSTGAFIWRAVRSAPSVTVPSTGTLGHGTATNSFAFLYAAHDTASFGGFTLCVNSVPVKTDVNQTISTIGTASGTSGLWGTTAAGVYLSFLARAKWNTGVSGTWTNPDAFVVGPEARYNRFDESNVTTGFTGHNPASGGAIFHQIAAGNSLLLGPGDWQLNGQFQWTNGNNSGQHYFGFYGANGANQGIGTAPTAMTSLTGLSLLAGFQGSVKGPSTDNTQNNSKFFGHSIVEIRVTTAQTVYGVPASSYSAGAITIDGTFVARRIKDPVS